MRLTRLRRAELLALLGVAALAVALSLEWSGGRQGWEVLGVGADVVVGLTCAMVAWTAWAIVTARLVSVAVAAGVLATVGASATLVIVLIETLDLAAARWPAWVGLIAAVAAAAGTWWSMRDERDDDPAAVRRAVLRSMPPT